MKQSRFALLAPAIVAILAIVAACTPAAPTATPAPPTPTSANTATPTPTGTPTPTPTATSTPTPTATPTATATPTPTPTPTLVEAVAIGEKAMVKLKAGGNEWTGVMIGEKGRILTTSSDLTTSPIAEFTIADGSTGIAWVSGRDDALDLAILDAIDPVREFDTIQLSDTEIPQVDSNAVLLQFLGSGTGLDKRTSRVIGIRQDLNTGIRYVQLQGLNSSGAQGGAMIDNRGRLTGLRMAEGQMVGIGVGRPGETYAIDANAILNSVLPRLQTGISVISAKSPFENEPGAPPPIPAIFTGGAAHDGVDVKAGDRLFAAVIKPGSPHRWYSTVISNPGRYVLSISVFKSGYTNTLVEFWMNAAKAGQTSTYVSGTTKTTNLQFP